jgi:hypothetical protein
MGQWDSTYSVNVTWEKWEFGYMYPDVFVLQASVNLAIFNHSLMDTVIGFDKWKYHINMPDEHVGEYILPPHPAPSYIFGESDTTRNLGGNVIRNYGAMSARYDSSTNETHILVSKNGGIYGEMTSDLILRFPDGSLFDCSSASFVDFVFDIDADNTVYAIIGRYPDYYWQTHSSIIGMVGFDPTTGLIKRNYGSGGIYSLSYLYPSGYSQGFPTRLYQNNIFNYLSYRDVLIANNGGPSIANDLYNKVIQFTLSELSPYEFSKDKLVHGVAKKTDQGDFIFLASTPLLLKVEASQTLPLAAYGGNKDNNTGFLDVFQLGVSDEGIDEYTYRGEVAPDITKEGTEPAVHPPLTNSSNFIPDARVFNWYDGTIDTVYVGYVKYLRNTGDIFTFDYGGGDEEDLPIHVHDEVELMHLETTNFQDVPYIFACTGDAPARFFEKKKRDMKEVNTVFVERNLNLPNSKITCIRCDDKV